MNGTDKSVNGPFTRYDPRDPDNTGKKSLLDLVIVSSSLYKYIDRMEIDKDLLWTPSKVVKGNIKYPDHYALQVIFKNLPMAKGEKKMVNRKQGIWSLKRRNG